MADFKGSKRTPTFSECEREGLYKAIFLRRDIRSHFVSNKTISDDVLFKIINAAHHAPSVGFSQPWNFILIRNKSTRNQVKESFLREHKRTVSMLDKETSKQEKYVSLKLEGIIESDINICVSATRDGLDLLYWVEHQFLKPGYTVYVVQFKIYGWRPGQKESE